MRWISCDVDVPSRLRRVGDLSSYRAPRGDASPYIRSRFLDRLDSSRHAGIGRRQGAGGVIGRRLASPTFAASTSTWKRQKKRRSLGIDALPPSSWD